MYCIVWFLMVTMYWETNRIISGCDNDRGGGMLFALSGQGPCIQTFCNIWDCLRQQSTILCPTGCPYRWYSTYNYLSLEPNSLSHRKIKNIFCMFHIHIECSQIELPWELSKDYTLFCLDLYQELGVHYLGKLHHELGELKKFWRWGAAMVVPQWECT